MRHGPPLHKNDARRQDRVSRRELTRKFTPGTLGVWGSTMFTVVGWSPTAAKPAVPGYESKSGYLIPAKEAQPASWEVAVLLDQRIETWSWTHLKGCKTLEEWASESDAVP